MSFGTRAHHVAIALYPATFRHEYGADMEQIFAELVADRGTATAWRRTTVDLLVTVPRYRLELIMNPDRTTTAVLYVGALLAIPAAALVMLGFYPAAILFGVILVVALAQRSRLARSLRTGSAHTRRRSLLTAAALALFAVATLAIGMADVSGEDPWPVGRVIAYNLVFFAAIVGSIAFLIAGLVARKSDSHGQPVASPTT